MFWKKHKSFHAVFIEYSYCQVSLKVQKYISAEYNIKKNWVILALFANFEVKPNETAQKSENVYCKCILELHFATINGL
jgi:hypothetical protein